MNDFPKDVRDGIKYSLYHYDLLMDFSTCDGEYILLHKVWIDDEYGNEIDVVYRIQEAYWDADKLIVFNTFYKEWFSAEGEYSKKVYNEIQSW